MDGYRGNLFNVSKRAESIFAKVAPANDDKPNHPELTVIRGLMWLLFFSQVAAFIMYLVR